MKKRAKELLKRVVKVINSILNLKNTNIQLITFVCLFIITIILKDVEEMDQSYVLTMNVNRGEGKGITEVAIPCDKPEILPKTKIEFKLLFRSCWDTSKAKEIFFPTIQDKSKFPIGDQMN